MLNIKSIIKKVSLTAISAAAVLTLSSCPEPITAPMVALVEDTIPPTINISTPRGGDNYYSSVTVTGIISDDVLAEGDESGQITTIYYEIANDDFRKGKINIGLDDTVTVDETFGSGTISYDISTKEFSFTFSTLQSAQQAKLRDVISLSITTVDRNSNITVSDLNLKESEGPFVDFGFYNTADFDDINRVSFITGDEVYISGTVSDSDYELDTADEITKIEWGVVGTIFGGTLDVTPGSDDWVEADGVFRSINHDEEYFFYDPETRRFSTHTTISLDDGAKFFFVEATDTGSHITEEQMLLSAPAPLMIVNTDLDIPFYSPNHSVDTHLTGIVLNPAQGVLIDGDVSAVYYNFISTDNGDEVPNRVVLYDPNNVLELDYGGDDPAPLYTNHSQIFEADGSFDITFNTGALAGLNGIVTLRLNMKDADEKDIPRKSFSFVHDSDAPDIDVTGFSSDGNNSGFARRGDTVTLQFNAEDTGAGISSIDLVSIYGETIPAGSVVQSGNTYTAEFQFDSGDSSNPDGTGIPISYTVELTDIVGNPASKTADTAEELMFYSPFPLIYTYSMDSSAATTNTGNTGWARASGSPALDSVTVEFTVPRRISGNPAVTMAGRPVSNVTSSYDSVNDETSCTAVLAMLGTEGYADGTYIPFIATITDIALNQETRSMNTAVQYDANAPNQPPAPVWSDYSYSEDYINFVDMSGTELTFTGGRSLAGAADGDTLEFYLNNSGAPSFATESFSGSVTQYTPVTFLNSAIGSPGPKTVYARVKDAAGNISGYSDVCNVTLDIKVDNVNAGSSYSGATSREDGFLHDSASATDLNDINLYSWIIDGPSTSNIYSTSSETSADLTVPVVSDGEGEYTATLEARDSAGNTKESSFTFIWDTLAPQITDLPTETVGVNDDFSQTATVDDWIADSAGIDTDSYQWDLDGPGALYIANYNDGTMDNTIEVTVGPIDDGEWTAIIYVSDLLGHQSSDSFTFFKDLNPPTFSGLTDNYPGSYNTGNFFKSANVTDGFGAGIDWTTRDLTKISGTGTVDYNVTYTETDEWNGSLTAEITDCSLDGDYTVAFSIVDDATNPSNTALAASRFRFYWDENAPEIDIPDGDRGAVDETFTRTATFNDNFDGGTGSGADTYSWSIDSGPGTISGLTLDGLTLNMNQTPTADGLYTMEFSASDKAGHSAVAAGGGTDQFTFYWDTTGPVVEAGTGPTDPVGTNFTHSGATAEEPTGAAGVVSTVWSVTGPNDFENLNYSTDLNPTFTISDFSTAGSNDGEYIAILTATDALDYSDFDTFTFVIDTVAPDAPTGLTCTQLSSDDYINYTESLGTISLEISYNGTADSNCDAELYIVDSSSSYTLIDTYDLDGSSTDIITFAGSTLPADADDFTFAARILDAAGNPSGYTATGAFDIDTAVDDPAFTVHAVGYYEDFTLTNTTNYSAEDSVTYHWSITDVTSPADSNAVTVSYDGSVSDGSKTAALYVTDAANNTSATDSHGFIWDADQFSIDSFTPASGTGYYNYASGGFTLEAIFIDDHSGIADYTWSTSHTKITCTDENPTTVAFSPGGPTETTHTISLVATDGLGRSNATAADFTFIYDNTAPTHDDIGNIGTVSDGATVTPANVSDGTGDVSGVASYRWVVTGPYGGEFHNSTFSYGPNATDLYLDDTPDTSYDGDYTVKLYIKDNANNESSADTFTFTWDGDNNSMSIGQNPFSTLFSGGSSTSSGSGGSGVSRINTYDFGNNTAEAVDSGQYNLRNVSSTSVARRTGSYSGGLFGRTAAAATVNASAEKPVAETDKTTSSPVAEKQPAVDEVAPDSTPDVSTQLAPVASSVVKALASATGNSAVSAASEIQPKREKNRSAMLLLIIPGAVAGIVIFRKRRL